MLELVCTLRASHLFLHHAHLLAKGSLFPQDHAFLGELYGELESDFDSIAERMIGLGSEKELSLPVVMAKVSEKLKSCPSTGVSENKVYFQKQMEFEAHICSLVDDLCLTNLSQGTIQALGDVANRSEIRQYKISRRIK